MALLIIAIASSLIVGLIGNNRRIGFWGSFFSCLLFTPFGGLFLTVLSGPDERIKRRRRHR